MGRCVKVFVGPKGNGSAENDRVASERQVHIVDMALAMGCQARGTGDASCEINIARRNMMLLAKRGGVSVILS